VTFQVCHACTAQRAMDAPACPHCGHAEPGTPDHEVAQILEDYEITMDELRGLVREGGVMPSPKINRQDGPSHPLNRAGEDAPRRFEGTGGSVEYGGREPAEEEPRADEQGGPQGETPGETAVDQPAEVDQAGDQLERPKNSDNRDKWVAYANQQDPTVDNNALTKAELVELYGS
jgi:hypothetical protein